MRKLLLSILLPAVAMASPQIEWLTPDYDFGAIAEADGIALGELRFVNNSGTPVSVTAVHTSCGCTTASVPRDEIAPGDTAAIIVKYDPTGRPGKFEKKVSVNFSDDNIPRQSLKIHGVVIGTSNTLRSRYPVDAGAMKLRASVVPFGEVKKSSAKSDFVEIYNASTDSLQPVWSNIPPYISIAPMEGKVAPGEQIVYNLMFSGTRAPLYGLVTDSLYVAASPDAEPVRIEIVGIVIENFARLTPEQLRNAPKISYASDRIDFGSYDPSHPVTMKYDISNTGRDPLLIRRVYTADKGIRVSIDKTKIKRGQHAAVTVSVDPAALEGEVLNGRISIISNDPANPTLTVRAVGLPSNF